MSRSAAFDTGNLSLVPTSPDIAAPRFNVEEISISLYDGHVPDFAVQELDRLYGSIYSTADQFSVDGVLDSANTCLVRRNGEITALLLFRLDGRTIQVMNQLITLPASEMERFASAVFAKYPQADSISFKAVRADLRDFHYLMQRHHCAEDIVAPLPADTQEFTRRLGKSTREIVKRYLNKVNRSFPTFRFDVYAGREIEEEKAAEIFRLHKERMRETQRTLKLDDGQFAGIVALAKLRGMMTVATIDGRVRGGLICWHVGGHYIMRIIAHDPEFNEYKLGLLCCYLTMQECIKRGAKSFHFMAGRLSYKYRLLGTEQYFDRIVVYRSLAALLRNTRTALEMMKNRAFSDTKLWIMNAEKRKDPLSIAIAGLISGWKRVKVFLRRPTRPSFPPRGNGNTTYSGSA